MIISEESNNSFTMVTVSVLPVRVVAPPRAPPKRDVAGRHELAGQVVVKAEAEAARPRTNKDCFIITIKGMMVQGR